MSTSDINSPQDPIRWIPDGYVVVLGPDEHQYVVSEFFVPALHQIFIGYRKKKTLQVFEAAGNVSTDH